MASIIISEDNLGAITLNYICENDGEMAEVDPTFFEHSGSPVCGECGEDMTVFSAVVSIPEGDGSSGYFILKHTD